MLKIPALHGNWVDFVIILFVAFYVWDRWGKGFLTHFFELWAFLGAFALALKFYPLAANLFVDNFSFSRGLANAIGFTVVGIGLEQVLVFLIDRLYIKIPKHWHENPVNKVMAILPMVANAFILIAFILILLLALPLKGWVKSGVVNSKIGGMLVSQSQSVEKTLGNIFGDAISDSLNFITTGPIESRENIKLNFTQHDVSIDEVSEQEMVKLINIERLKRGLPTLKPDEKLRDLARVYSRDMLEKGFFSHYDLDGKSPFDRMKEQGITYLSAGENLALAPNVIIAHQGLMDSKGHRENILNPDYGKVGVGVMDGGIYGKMFVQEFTN